MSELTELAVHRLAVVVEKVVASTPTADTSVVALMNAHATVVNDTNERHGGLPRQGKLFLHLNGHAICAGHTANLKHENVRSRDHALLTRVIGVAAAIVASKPLQRGGTGRKVQLGHPPSRFSGVKRHTDSLANQDQTVAFAHTVQRRRVSRTKPKMRSTCVTAGSSI